MLKVLLHEIAISKSLVTIFFTVFSGTLTFSKNYPVAFCTISDKESSRTRNERFKCDQGLMHTSICG